MSTMNANACKDDAEPGLKHGRLPDGIGQSKSPDVCATSDVEDNVFEDTGDCDLSSEYKYGWFSWHPEWLQPLNSPKWLLVFMCVYTFLQGLVINGFINVVISTLERRFNLPSRQSGLIASTYDISSALLVVFVSYYGGRGHKPKWLAFGCIIMAVGSLIFALPHFATGLYTNVSGSLVCVVGSKDKCHPTTAQSAESPGLSSYLFVFLASQVLHGIGCTPLYSIGVTLIDESVNVHQSALYLAIFFSIAALGPSLGYLLGGALLSLYVDFGQVDVASLGITSSDSSWLGAWWIGFLIGGTVAFFVAVPISGFPKELPSTARIRARKVSQAHVTKRMTHTGFGTKLGDFPRAVRSLIMNAPFVCLVVVTICKGATVAGFGTFGPKVIETQFSKSAADASLLFGVCAIPGAVLGTFLGGYITKRWHFKVRGMLRFSFYSVLAALLSFLGVLLSCSEEYVVGVNIDYYGNMKDNMTVPSTPLHNDCNSGCGCPMEEFNPVCGDNGLEYFDACFAGCTEQSESSKIFSGCTCLALSDTNVTTMTATRGKCAKDCSYLPFFMLSLTMTMVFQFMASMPTVSAMLRCVRESQRSLAMGIDWLFIRLLGSIPAPIVFGAVLDSSCILWQKDCNGNQGSCFLYSAKTVSWRLVLMGCTCGVISLLFLFIALRCYTSPEDGMKRNKNGDKLNKKKRFFNVKRFTRKTGIDRMNSTSSQRQMLPN